MAICAHFNAAAALQALLSSISSGNRSVENGQDMTPGQVRKISDKLGELLGGGDVGGDVGNQRRNEKGEVCSTIRTSA